MDNKPKDSTPKDDSNEPAVITKGQWRDVLKENEILKGKRGLQKAKRVSQSVARLRFHEDKPVVWYGNIKERKDGLTGKLVSWMDIKVLDSDEVYTVEYLDFLNSRNAESVLILEEKAEEVVSEQGTMAAENPDPMNNKRFQSTEVEMEVVTRFYTAKVEVKTGSHTGEIYTLPALCLNS